jgi:hypothetical protein
MRMCVNEPISLKMLNDGLCVPYTTIKAIQI